MGLRDFLKRKRGTSDSIEHEEKLIEEWTKREGLNKYGDKKNTTYTGGDPLFDEKTGKSKPYQSYMSEKFKNKPWKKGYQVE